MLAKVLALSANAIQLFAKKKLLLLQQLAITGSREKFLLFLLSRNLFLSLEIACKICQVLVYVFNHLR